MSEPEHDPDLHGSEECPPRYDFEVHPGRMPAAEARAAERRAERFRDVLGHYASGVTVVATVVDEKPVGMTCQSFMSVSLEPPLVAFLPTRESRTFAAIQETGVFCVSFLAAEQAEISDQLAGPGEDKFSGLQWRPTAGTGSPVLAGAVGHVDCTLDAVHEAGDHVIVVGRVVGLDAGEERAPLLYHRGRYVTTRD